MYLQEFTKKKWLKGATRFGGLYTILLGDEEKEKDIYGRTNDLWGKNMVS